MAQLGDLFIAGNECKFGQYRCGISYPMTGESPISRVYAPNDTWQVEFKEGMSNVVARTSLFVGLDELQKNGFAVIQEALDVMSVKGVFSLNLMYPPEITVGVYCEEKDLVLYVNSVNDLNVDVKLEVKVHDEMGNELNPPSIPDPQWHPSFRYYRLSLSSTDLFEAYRNLYLGFEALLGSISIKRKNEGERSWLRRCLSSVNSRKSLDSLVPRDIEDPVGYILTSQYEAIRCNLMHAKRPDALLPHSRLSPVDVKQAFSELAVIWKGIAGTYFGVTTGGGVITSHGFEIMMGFMKENPRISYTTDNVPSHKDDTTVSPNNVDVYDFSTIENLGQIKPGIVRTVARDDVLNLPGNFSNPIYRIGVQVESVLFSVDYIQPGLTVQGVQVWEFVHDVRIINKSQSRMDSFRTSV